MSQRAPREFTGRHMLVLVISFFGVIIGVNIAMAVASSRTWTGLVVANSYVASQEFQIKRDRARQQYDSGWRGAITYADGAATFTLMDDTGQPIDAGKVSISFKRPVGDQQDQVLVLARAADGSYSGKVALDSGVWHATVLAGETPLGGYELVELLVAP